MDKQYFVILQWYLLKQIYVYFVKAFCTITVEFYKIKKQMKSQIFFFFGSSLRGGLFDALGGGGCGIGGLMS